ncbi:hypothetical protein CFBP498_45200 [Xanthomonas hortorum pv. vitians]|nr:hypothetical protein CFBP498_45200 [Xanthomonas hortorum pv. vitians]CAD0360688.1 hypothetical protein CFBP498_45200 [Xanthomonas hortorum pv. vitians]
MARSTRTTPAWLDAAPALVGTGLTTGAGAVIARLTAARTRPYREHMDNAAALAQLRALAARVEALVERTQRLTDENRSLRHQQEQLIGERAQLLTKNEQARSRVEAMIVRLKSLEQHT